MQSGLEPRGIDRVGLVGKLCGDLVMLSLASTASQAVEDCLGSKFSFRHVTFYSIIWRSMHSVEMCRLRAALNNNNISLTNRTQSLDHSYG